MKEEGFGAGYVYDHDMPNAFSGRDYFPDAMGRTEFYAPTDYGAESDLRKRMVSLAEDRVKLNQSEAE